MEELTPDLNPLNSLKQHTVFHILVAFEYAEDAYTSRISSDIGEQGHILNANTIGGRCGGKAIVIINEFVSEQARINTVKTNWSFFSPASALTSSYTGTMEVTDRSGFLFTESLSKLIYNESWLDIFGFNNPEIDVSLHHLTFAWVPVFVGTYADSGQKENIYVNPLYFNVTKFTQGVTAVVGRTYIMDFVSCYNTFGTGPQFSRIAQNTVTTAAGSTINTVPTEFTDAERLQPIRVQDSKKIEKRKRRLDKTTYMRTIGDACEGFQLALNAQTRTHKSQVQKFLEIVQDDYKSGTVTPKSSEKIPLKYSINVDNYYKSLELDNRNLPFEQYEQDQNVPGVSSITFPSSYDISSALFQIMRMSKKVGRDFIETPTNVFKITTTTNHGCDNTYSINVKINKYISPYNSKNGVNTGPGTSPVVNGKVIEYTYQDIDAADVNVNAISYAAIPFVATVPYDEVDSKQGYTAIYGDREPVSAWRTNGVSGNFFENAFSGLKGTKGLLFDNALENSEIASNITNFNPYQHIRYAISVMGNPFLLNDINRNPLDVIDENSNVGNYVIYKNIEYDPMYIKLKIYLAGDTRSEISEDATFYYEDYLHVTDIETVITSGAFTQTIYCTRTEEKL